MKAYASEEILNWHSLMPNLSMKILSIDNQLEGDKVIFYHLYNHKINFSSTFPLQNYLRLFQI